MGVIVSQAPPRPRRPYQAPDARNAPGSHPDLPPASEHVSRRIASAEWGDRVIDELAATLARRYPGLPGFTRRHLSLRMRQFYEVHRGDENVSALLTQT